MTATMRNCGYLLAVILAGHAFAQQAESPLAPYVDIDLTKLEPKPKAELKALLAKLLPKKYQPDRPFAAEPWHVWKHGTDETKPRFVLFRAGRLFSIPGGSRAVVHFFDESTQLNGTAAFSTGWRIDLTRATLKTDEALEGSCIYVESTPVINGREVRGQVYGIVGDRLALLWLEDASGKMIPNIYEHPNHTIGPPVPKRDPEEWEKALSSDQPMTVLEALTWLGGRHAPKTQTDVLTEAQESIELVASVRQRDGVRKALEKLTGSNVPRLQEAAKLAVGELPKQGDGGDDPRPTN